MSLQKRNVELIDLLLPDLLQMLVLGPGGDMTKAVYDTDNDGIVDAAESVPWTGVTGKPATYPPSVHTHVEADITDLVHAIVVTEVDGAPVVDAQQIRFPNGSVTDSGGGIATIAFPAVSHDLLSATHPDTTPAAAVLGDLVTGQAGPVWARLPIGGAGEVLTVVAGVPGWAPTASSFDREALIWIGW